MSDPAAAPSATAQRVLFVGHKIDDAVRRFLDSCSQRGWHTLRVGDVYLAMGRLAQPDAAPIDQVVVDSRVLNAGEERFLSLARRYYPRLVVRALDEVLSAEHPSFFGAAKTIQSPASTGWAPAELTSVPSDAALPDRNLSAEWRPHPQPRRESTPDALREVIDRAWRAAHADQSGQKQRTDPRHAAPGSDEPAGPSPLKDDEPIRPPPSPTDVPPSPPGSSGQSSQHTSAVRPVSSSATPPSPVAPVGPAHSGEAGASPPASGPVSASTREPSLHDAVRMRMRAATSGGERPIVRIPPGERRPPSSALPLSRSPEELSSGAELTREELDSLLGESRPTRDGGAA